MKKDVILILSAFSLFACSHDALTDNEVNSDKINNVLFETETLLIDKEPVSLTAEDAKKVTLRLSSIRNDFKARSAKDGVPESLDVMEITDTDSDTGRFDPNAETASRSYLEDYKMQIKEASQDKSDSLRMKYSLEWAIFEKAESDGAAYTRASSATVDQMVQDEINRKTAMGYTYIGKIGAAAYYLPASDYQELVMDVSAHTDPVYNYEDVSLFFIKSYDFEQVGPLMNTQWHQHAPFNFGAADERAGCVPIAVAQIVYYHKYPNKYDWSQIAPSPTLTDGFKYFITDIRSLCGITSESDKSSATYDDAYNAFQSLGYNATKAGLPDFIKLRNELKAQRPVYIRGHNPQTDKGHAWVCEGYKNIKYEGVISMIIDSKYGEPSVPGSPYFDYVFSAYPSSSLDQDLYGEFFYMNMGRYAGDNNGWYRANSYNPNRPDISYLEDQKIITVKR
ncbi:C10 family peptidase [Phocaeicola sp.]|uniref:C10 family peptidase n=1 Tax=Phocaeicola sp. TaxID=2773926 RepID=UPI0023C214E9|nr:C10 family peptidase [Phocaeicola sp.]MDE5678145.1 C10 family peptidase [Phocaeicola sp.]